MRIIGHKHNNKRIRIPHYTVPQPVLSYFIPVLIWKPGPEVHIIHRLPWWRSGWRRWRVSERQAGRRINDRHSSARPGWCLWLQAADRRLSVIRPEDAGAGVGLLVPPLPGTHHHRSHISCVRRAAAVRWGECALLLSSSLLDVLTSNYKCEEAF